MPVKEEFVHDNRPLVTPKQPTRCPPGSEAKILEMIARVERGETPCHPLDRRHNEDDAGWAVTSKSKVGTGWGWAGDDEEDESLTFPLHVTDESSEVVEVPGSMTAVNPLDHYRVNVTKCVRNLLTGEPLLKLVTGVRVTKAVRRNAVADPTVKADPLGGASKVPGKRVPVPRSAVAVSEDVSGSGPLLHPLQEPNNDRPEHNDPCPASLTPSLVVLEPDVRPLPSKGNVRPRKNSHLAGPSARPAKKEKRTPKALASLPHKGKVLTRKRRASRIVSLALNGTRPAVRAAINKFLVFGPAKARKHGGHVPALGGTRLPSRVGSNPLGQVELSAVTNLAIANERAVALQATPVVQDVVGTNVSKLMTLRDVIEIRGD